ncbi:MAG: ParA family protein [Prochloraceae cyanobacterium]|nr:ParA family protein [Prochloraceae cyanobacterium]
MNNQIVLGLLSEAGGVGKTTIAVNLAYEWSCRDRSAVILDLDSNHSLEDFVGLGDDCEADETIVKVFSKDFQGDWPLQTPPEFPEKFQVCQGHSLLNEIEQNLVSKKRREYILCKLLKDYPLSSELVILDCNAGWDLISYNVLAASTHLLIPLDMGVKVKTAARLIETILLTASELELDPMPEIIGLIPNRYNKGASVHEEFLKQLPEVAESVGIKLYPAIRTWQYLNNSAVFGLPLKRMRAADPLVKIFSAIANDLEKVQDAQT